jgi:hypothetical protein
VRFFIHKFSISTFFQPPEAAAENKKILVKMFICDGIWRECPIGVRRESHAMHVDENKFEISPINNSKETKSVLFITASNENSKIFSDVFFVFSTHSGIQLEWQEKTKYSH